MAKYKVQHFTYEDGSWAKSIKYLGGYQCPVCGAPVRKLKKYGRVTVVDCERIYLLDLDGSFKNTVYGNNGSRYHGTIVEHPERGYNNYVVGYKEHSCGCKRGDENE
jgi:hypothetical protein